ncbi:MAG: ion channel [Gammaproteobacteria bacterium]|nr:two pore domain potassium channel family protein [Pseudomonadales bacterium]MCP5348890.1 two pore domain potassium channel family protein [Pseudomonadales bacterium]
MLTTFIFNTILISAAVVIHYEILHLLSAIIPRLAVQHRLRVIIGVFGTLLGHVVEIWMFGIAYFLMVNFGDFGSLQGNFDGSLLDYVYFSFTTYTSLGIGDVEPLGDIRFLAGLEALTGLSLITWSASFMFIEMRKFWE